MVVEEVVLLLPVVLAVQEVEAGVPAAGWPASACQISSACSGLPSRPKLLQTNLFTKIFFRGN